MWTSFYRVANRAWYYFRIGYSTYLTFLLGYASTLVTVYYLAIKSVPDLLVLFPKFVPFAVICTVVGVPLSVGVGWIHLKRSRLYSSEQDIAIESNPYNYKIPPGFWTEAFTPLYLEILVQLRKLSDAEGLLTDAEKSRIDDIEKKMRTLIDGGIVGNPRRGAF